MVAEIDFSRLNERNLSSLSDVQKDLRVYDLSRLPGSNAGPPSTMRAVFQSKYCCSGCLG